LNEERTHDGKVKIEWREIVLRYLLVFASAVGAVC
jgi:hypothetical protein